MKQRKPGELGPHQLAVVDHRGNLRGRVHAGATSVTAARFLGVHGATLGKHKGHTAWIGPAPAKSTPRRNSETKNHAAARGSVGRRK